VAGAAHVCECLPHVIISFPFELRERLLTAELMIPGIQEVLEQEPSSRWCPKQIAGNRRAVSMLNYQALSALMREYPVLQGVVMKNQGTIS